MEVARIPVLAARYLRGHLRRYAFLLVAVSFGFAIITAMTAMSDGMEMSVKRAAREHYAGDLFVVGHDADHGRAHRIADDASVQAALTEAGLADLVQVRRTIAFKDGILRFAGASSRQKNVYGVDWDVEGEALAGMDFVAGGVPGSGGLPVGFNGSPGEAILISQPVAEALGARLGDDVILQVETLTGQVNTGTFIIAGIFRDSSIFGFYKGFVDRRTLNRLIGIGEDEYSSLGLYLPRRFDGDGAAARLREALAARLETAPPIEDKEAFNRERRRQWKGIRLFVISLDVYVSEVAELLTAMEIVSYVVFVMIALIVLVSIAVTYKLVINERTREIGTLRAVGMKRRTVRIILLIEAFYLYIASLVAGLTLAAVILGLVSLLSFDWIPGFEIFTRGGRLVGVIRGGTVAANATLLLAIVLPAVWVPTARASRLSLTEALSTE